MHRFAVGHADITGDDFGGIFAKAINGEHRSSPLGIADVTFDNCAWSVKTVGSQAPHQAANVRLISGRNSPDYSLGIHDPHANPEATGRAVLSIWNARVNEALDEYDDLRVAVFIRDMTTRHFLIFEEEAGRFAPGDYQWAFNSNGNLEGSDADRRHVFTWQPHGSQFTIFRRVPPSARKFRIVPNVPVVTEEAILAYAKFRPDWIEIVR
ncbi:MAG: hypothetical protein Q7R41_16710 [Phycisphaerales bacterium]|nr:hypothetical protein [Phycisphaerales bacterium]